MEGIKNPQKRGVKFGQPKLNYHLIFIKLQININAKFDL